MPINIIESVNHELSETVWLDEEKKLAKVALGKNVDRSKASEKDFVFYFRGFEKADSEPVCFVKRSDGIQSVFLQIIPDNMNAIGRIQEIKK